MDFDGFVITERLRSFGIDISEQEYIDEINESGTDDSLRVTESIIIKRLESLLEKEDYYEIKMLLFRYSHVVNGFDREMGFKYRKYCMMFDHIKQLLGSELTWEVSYIGDNRCGICSIHEGELFDIEKEAVNPTVPMPGCRNPHKICIGSATYLVKRDDKGKPIRHRKDYRKLIKLTIYRD